MFTVTRPGLIFDPNPKVFIKILEYILFELLYDRRWYFVFILCFEKYISLQNLDNDSILNVWNIEWIRTLIELEIIRSKHNITTRNIYSNEVVEVWIQTWWNATIRTDKERKRTPFKGDWTAFHWGKGNNLIIFPMLITRNLEPILFILFIIFQTKWSIKNSKLQQPQFKCENSSLHKITIWG